MTDLRPTELDRLGTAYDPELRLRRVVPPVSWLVGALLVALSLFHYFTAGFGLLREATQRGIHLAFVLFLVFGWRRGRDTSPSRLAPGGVPLLDWLLTLLAVAASLYVPWTFDDLAFRVTPFACGLTRPTAAASRVP